LLNSPVFSKPLATFSTASRHEAPGSYLRSSRCQRRPDRLKQAGVCNWLCYFAAVNGDGEPGVSALACQEQT
jgi:hypothetical protein